MLSRQRWLIRIFTVDLHKWRQKFLSIPLWIMLQGKTSCNCITYLHSTLKYIYAHQYLLAYLHYTCIYVSIPVMVFYYKYVKKLCSNL